MQQVINQVLYDTNKSTLLYSIQSEGDKLGLYRTSKGGYFLAWEFVDSPGKIQPLSKEGALVFLEKYGATDTLLKHFLIEEA